MSNYHGPRPSLSLNRRTLLKAGAATMLSGALVGIGGRPLWAADVFDQMKPQWDAAGIDWMQEKGKKLVISGVLHPWTNALGPLIPHFTRLTGIEVEVQTQAETEYAAQLPVKLGAGSSTPDVYMVWAVGQAIQAGWLEPLDDMMSDKNLINASWWEGEDFFSSARQLQTWSDGKQYLMPITAETQILFMNKPMMAERGLSSPKTMDELLTVAKALKTDDVAGIAMRAKPTGDSAWAVGGFIFSYGGMIIGTDGTSGFDKPETIAGVEMYARILREAGPAGISNYQWSECLNDFMSGASAMGCDSSVFATEIANPEKSQVAGNALYSMMPPAGNLPVKPCMWHWMTGINSKSENKKAAFLFMQWINSKPTTLLMGTDGFPTARASTWASEAFRTRIGEEAATAALASLKAGDGALFKATWLHPKGPQILDALAVAVNETATGAADAQAAMKKASLAVNKILA